MMRVLHSTGVLNMFATSGFWDTSANSYHCPDLDGRLLFRRCSEQLGPVVTRLLGGGFRHPSACGFLREER